MQESRPQRRKLPHEIPAWVKQGARHFITVNCRDRSSSSLCKGTVAERLLESALEYEERGRWFLWLMVIMPDHIHLIATFDLGLGIRHTMQAWKSYQRKYLRIEWQSGFFEHRLRNDAEFIEKAQYVRMNPVCKGLTATAEEWPFVADWSAATKQHPLG